MFEGAAVDLDDWRAVVSVGDGTLPNGAAFDTGPEQWAAVLAAIEARGWGNLPDANDPMLVIRAGPGEGVLINIWRFGWDSIDFDFDLRELQTQQALDRFCDFVRVLGRAADRDVVLTAEGVRGESPRYAIYRHTDDRFELDR